MSEQPHTIGSQTTERAQPLEFDTDRGSSRSAWIAGAIVVALVLWMGSGFVLPSGSDGPEQGATELEPATVLVRESTARPVTLTFSAEGQALPERDTEIRAEASGSVQELAVRKGADVEAGALIATISSENAQATLAQAEEERSRALREFENASQLLERGVATTDRVAQARATLAAAEAAVTRAEQTLEDLHIVAPFAGRIETLAINEGEYVTQGGVVGRIVDNRPLTVAIQVPQQSLDRIRTGQTADVSFITGDTRTGVVTFVGTAAAAETRTFLAEIEVANEDGSIPAGVSAEVTIPTGETQAHLISPSIVSLDPDGVLGVKTENDGVVAFQPIDIVKAEIDGVWARGLPENARIITVGQGFVREGDNVNAQIEQADDAGEAAQ